MKEKLVTFIKNQLLYSDDRVELNGGEDLLGSGIIDSMGMMKLISFIENEFSTSIPPEDMVVENFMSVNAIVKYLEIKQ